MVNTVFVDCSEDATIYLGELKSALAPARVITPDDVANEYPVGSVNSVLGLLESKQIKAIVALVSQRYLRSLGPFDFAALIAAADARGVKLLWVLLSECAWGEIPVLKEHAPAYPVAKPVDQMEPAERVLVWETLAQEVRRILSPATRGDSTAAPSSSTTASTPEESMCAAHVTDQPAARDALGFKPYVEAVVHFLTQPQTEPPLTLSIEGEWGSGKSSFMLQVEKLLKAEGALTVHFNAWRHDKEDALWAAFALEFLRQIQGSLWAKRYWAGRWRLFWRRFKWKDGFWDVLRCFGLWGIAGLFAAVAVGYVFTGSDSWAKFLVADINELVDKAWWEGALQWIFRGGGTLTSLVLLVSTWIKIRDTFGNPLEVNLKKHIESPDYDKRVAFVEQFHEDFAKVVEAYAGDKKVFVFVDDVDRCEVPKAADLMQALNLLISNDPRLIFIIGMDREKVAAGIAVKHEKLLPYLAPGAPDGDSPKGIDRTRALEYGYTFIEKFVQIPFLVPQPREEDLDGFLANVAAPRTAEPGEPVAVKATVWLKNTWKQFFPNDPADVPALERMMAKRDETIMKKEDAAEAIQKLRSYKEALRLTFGTTESDNVRRIAKLVAPLFDYNPRRLKQFINVFRLQAYIGSRVGLFGNYGEEPSLVQLDQLGKFVAISLRYPLLRAELEEDRTLLSGMQNCALGLNREPTPRMSYWLGHPGVRELLRKGCVDSAGSALPTEERRGCMAHVDIDKFLRVCPVVMAPPPLSSAAPPVEKMQPKESPPEESRGNEPADVELPPLVKSRAVKRSSRSVLSSVTSKPAAKRAASKPAARKKVAQKK